MLKIEASKMAFTNLRAVPFAWAAGNSLGGGRHCGSSTVIA